MPWKTEANFQQLLNRERARAAHAVFMNAPVEIVPETDAALPDTDEEFRLMFDDTDQALDCERDDHHYEVGREFDVCHGGHVRLDVVDGDVYTFRMIGDIDRKTFRIARGIFGHLLDCGAVRFGYNPHEARG